MWRATMRNKSYKEWVNKREKQIEEEYKDKPLEVGWKDILAMIIAAFQVLAPIFLLVALFITLVFVGFHFIIK